MLLLCAGPGYSLPEVVSFIILCFNPNFCSSTQNSLTYHKQNFKNNHGFHQALLPILKGIGLFDDRARIHFLRAAEVSGRRFVHICPIVMQTCLAFVSKAPDTRVDTAVATFNAGAMK